MCGVTARHGCGNLGSRGGSGLRPSRGSRGRGAGLGGAPGRARGRSLELRRGGSGQRRRLRFRFTLLPAAQWHLSAQKPPPSGPPEGQAPEPAARGLELPSRLVLRGRASGGRLRGLLGQAPRSLTEGARHLCPRCRLRHTGARVPSRGAHRACDSRPGIWGSPGDRGEQRDVFKQKNGVADLVSGRFL